LNLPRSTYCFRLVARTEGLTDAELTAVIEDIQDELPCYGYHHVTHEFRRHGFLINQERVARSMQIAGLGIKPPRRFVRTTDSGHDSPIFPNMYCNNISDPPDRGWVADSTYILVVKGFCYLAVILDA
jgi:putative transposase